MAAKNFANVSMIFVAIFAVQGTMAKDKTAATKLASADYAGPLSFEPNRGRTDKQVDFLARGAGYGLFLSHAEAVILLQRGAPAKPGSHTRPVPLSSAAVRLSPSAGTLRLRSRRSVS